MDCSNGCVWIVSYGCVSCPQEEEEEEDFGADFEGFSTGEEEEAAKVGAWWVHLLGGCTCLVGAC